MKKSNSTIAIIILSTLCLMLPLLWIKQHSLTKTKHIPQYDAVPSVPNPDYKKIGNNMDDAYNALADKEYEVDKQSIRLHLSGDEMQRRVLAVRKIGQAEINRVQATGFMEPFNPDVWKQLPFKTAP